MGILDDLIYGYRDIYDAAGQLLPRRTKLRVLGEGVTAVDNPVTGQTELTLAGGGSTPSAIVVDRAMLAGALSVIDPSYVVAENTITGTGTAPALLGETVLIVALGRPGFISEAGWYEVTLADGTDWTLTRLPGTTAGTVMPAGQVTIVRYPPSTWEDWIWGWGGSPPANGVGVHGWELPDAATMASTVSGQQAVFRPAVDVPHALLTPSVSNVVVMDMYVDAGEFPTYTATATTLESDANEALPENVDGKRLFFAAGEASPHSGWYVVTRSDAPWLITRLPGLDTSEGIRDRTLTLFASSADAGGAGVLLVDANWPGGTLGTTPLLFELWNDVPNMPFSATTPAGVGSAGSAGAATTVSRSDHVHAHGAQSWDAGAGLAHPVATSTDPGFMSAAQAQDLANTVSAVALLPAASVGLVASEAIVFPSSSTSDTTVYTVPASPSGDGRFVLTRVLVRVVAPPGEDATATVRVGTTTGGDDIIIDYEVTDSTGVGVLIGESIADLGAGLPASDGYERRCSADDTIKVRITATTGDPSAGSVKVYVFGFTLP